MTATASAPSSTPAPSSPLAARAAETAALENLLRDRLAAAGRVPGAAPEFRRLLALLEEAVAGGKKLRPLLLLRAVDQLVPPAAAGAHAVPTGGDARHDAASAPALEAAAAVELLHQGFLLHDDVIDEDLRRRGRPNVYGVFVETAAAAGAPAEQARAAGLASAVVGGDLLLAAAHQAVARLDLPRRQRLAALDALQAAVADSAAGEQSDAILSCGTRAPGTEEVRDMLRRKTAAYSFRLPLELAGILADRPDTERAALAEIGTELGLVYQIRDDVLGTFGDPALTGKSACNDLREGKTTLLVLRARTHPAWTRAAHLFGAPGLTEETAGPLREALRVSGALEAVETELEDRLSTLDARIRDCTLPTGLQDLLRSLAAYCARRTS